ncbi:hypothetical protein BDW62DRAFT_206664 [Aspergillus aurantiobrunneus]
MTTSSGAPIPAIAINPTPAIKADNAYPENDLAPLWIFYDEHKELPKPGTLAGGLAQHPDGTLSPVCGSISGLGIPLERVVIVDKEGQKYTRITRDHLLKCTRKDYGPAPKVGSVAEGILNHRSSFVEYGRGRVVKVLENVMVFMTAFDGEGMKNYIKQDVMGADLKGEL